jgi:uridylate kinase
VSGMTYRRILVKLSGGAFAAPDDFGFEKQAVDHLADEILSISRQGAQVAIMVGGGNIFRGRLADQWGIERAEADNIGMMATVINSLFLRGALRARGADEVRVMTAIPMASVAEPYIRLRAIKHLDKGHIVIFGAGNGQPFVTTDYPSVQRAIEIQADVILVAKQGVNGVFTSDPNQDRNARQFTTLPYDEVINRGLRVMDQSAFILARDHGLPVHVFDAATSGTMLRLINGEKEGTYIGPEVAAEFA